MSDNNRYDFEKEINIMINVEQIFENIPCEEEIFWMFNSDLYSLIKKLKATSASKYQPARINKDKEAFVEKYDAFFSEDEYIVVTLSNREKEIMRECLGTIDNRGIYSNNRLVVYPQDSRYKTIKSLVERGVMDELEYRDFSCSNEERSISFSVNKYGIELIESIVR